MARTPRVERVPPGSMVGLVWNETTKDKLTFIGKIDPTDAEIASFFRVGLSTWVSFKGHYPEAAEAVSAGKAAGNIGIKTVLLKQALAGDTRPLLFLAERRLGYQAKQIVQQIQEGAKLDLSKLSTEELESWLALHAKAQSATDREGPVGEESAPLH